MIYCKNCKSKFSSFEKEVDLEGKLIKCKYCKHQWIYESKSKHLENRLSELDQDLIKTETQLKEKIILHNNQIENLQKNLEHKKEELQKQKTLEEKVLEFEKRINQTEKINQEQTEQKLKISKIENEIKRTSSDITTKNIDIEQKTNYIEDKINSYNKTDIITKSEKMIINDNQIIDLIPRNKENQKKIKSEDDKKKKKYSFFSPTSIE